MGEGGEVVKQFTVELDDTVCKWLEHIAQVTGESTEKIIANGIFHQVSNLENSIYKTFTYNDREQ